MAPISIHLRARQKDRDAVVDALSGAFAEGQITPKEHEKRVGVALRSASVSVLRNQLLDLQIPDEHPASKLAARAQPPVQAQPPTPSARTTWTRKAKVALAAPVVGAALLFGGFQLFGAEDDPPEPAVLSAAGFETLVADVEQEFGSTEVLSVEADENSVTVLIPSDTGSGRYERYSYRSGTGFSQGLGGNLGADDFDLIDLGELDSEALMGNIDDARTDLGVVEVSKVAVNVADAYWSTTFAQEFGDGDIPAHVGIEVSNEFSESAWLATDLAGDKILGSQPFEPAK